VNKVTSASLGYPLSVFNKKSTLKAKSHSQLAQRDIEKSEFLDFVDFGGVASQLEVSMETVIHTSCSLMTSFFTTTYTFSNISLNGARHIVFHSPIQTLRHSVAQICMNVTHCVCVRRHLLNMSQCVTEHTHKHTHSHTSTAHTQNCTRAQIYISYNPYTFQ